MYGNDPYSTPAFAGTTEPPSLPVLTYAPKVGMFAGIDESQAIIPILVILSLAAGFIQASYW